MSQRDDERSPLAVVEILWKLFESDVHGVVTMRVFRCEFMAEFLLEALQKIDLFGPQPRDGLK